MVRFGIRDVTNGFDSLDGRARRRVRGHRRVCPTPLLAGSGVTIPNEHFFEQNGQPRGGSDVSGKRLVFGSGCGLDEVRAAFDELLLMPDHGAIYVALAGAVANYASGDPVWPLLVGPSGSGKTEVVSSITSAPNVWPLSSLTPQTLLSGFERQGEARVPPTTDWQLRHPRLQGPNDRTDDAPRSTRPDHRPAS